MAFDVECDVGAVEDLGPEEAEHATVESAESPKETDTTIFSSVICSAKGMSCPPP